MGHVAHMGGKKNAYSVNVKGRDHFGELGMHGRISEWSVECIQLAKEWWVVVNTLMNLQISQKVGNFLTR